MTDLIKRLRRFGDIEAADEIERLTAERDALRADAERWRWWRNFWPALCRIEVAWFVGLDLSRTHVQGPNDMDAVTDAAIDAARKDKP